MTVSAKRSVLPYLPDDVARCPGDGDGDGDGDGEWREGCENCARRLAPPANENCTVFMEPPAIIVFECEYLIEI